MSIGKPLQIITIRAPNESSQDPGDSFHLLEENLNLVLNKVPKSAKVTLISVVGAFRTGKSFLLNFFLRFLRHGSPEDLGPTWMTADGPVLSEGNLNEHADAGPESFAWRGGQERQTTGIWMWSEPFLRTSAAGENVAVLLMDTQGMFDSDTSMTLTAQIFGLSTFVSSYQIYNVDKRLQEDNLQHLALFSEYGRLALRGDIPQGGGSDDDEEDLVQLRAEEPKLSGRGTAAAAMETEDAKSHRHLRRTVSMRRPPFQRLQFLVRDWQNFSQEWPEDIERQPEVYGQLREEMTLYLESVLRPRDLGDLQSTREQILRCFEHIDLYLLPHPGPAVTRRAYFGAVAQIDPFFLALLDRFCRLVLCDRLEPKVLNGRAASAADLRTYFQVYTRSFQQSGGAASGFPRAMTLLEATAEATNRTALQHALDTYTTALGALVTESGPYQAEAALQLSHEAVVAEALRLFDKHTGLGSAAEVEHYRAQLEARLADEWARYRHTNRLRNPYLALEPFILPAAVATVTWAATALFDQWCTSQACEVVEATFGRICLFVALGLLIYAYSVPFRDAHLYTLPLGVAAVSWLVAAVINGSCGTTACVKAGDAFERVYLFLGFALLVLLYKNFSGAFGYVRYTLLPLLWQQINVAAAAGGADSRPSSINVD